MTDFGLQRHWKWLLCIWRAGYCFLSLRHWSYWIFEDPELFQDRLFPWNTAIPSSVPVESFFNLGSLVLTQRSQRRNILDLKLLPMRFSPLVSYYLAKEQLFPYFQYSILTCFFLLFIFFLHISNKPVNFFICCLTDFAVTCPVGSNILIGVKRKSNEQHLTLNSKPAQCI